MRALGCKGEAAGPYGAGAGGQALGFVGDPPARDRRALLDQVVEAPRPPRDRLVSAAEPGESKAIAVRLLPGKPAIGRQSRGKDGRARVVDRHRAGDADEAPALAGPREGGLEAIEGARGVDHRAGLLATARVATS